MKKNVALFGLGRIGLMHAKNIVLNSKFKLSERRDPIIDFPEPIIPIKTRFLFEFIVLYWKNTNMS